MHLAPALTHLNDVIDVGGVRLCLSAPPRHAKSETACFHLIAKYLATHPDHLVAYCSYSARIAESRSKTIREYAVRAGCSLSPDTRSAGEWRTREGGGLLARGVEGALTGFGVQLLVIDDPFRDRAEAESIVMRNKVWDWWTSTAYTRLEAMQTSAIVTHTRWAIDDPIGRITEFDADRWKYINLPALSHNDTVALWPERWPVSALLERRKLIGEYDWSSLYQGEPRPRGANVFNGCYFGNPNDIQMRRIVVGLDLAYTSKTYSDWNVAVVLGHGIDGQYYVLEVLRRRCQTPQFIAILKEMLARYSWPAVMMYVGGVEKGVTDFAETLGVKIHTEPAKADKFVRAQPVAAAWNAGKILLPNDVSPESWRGAFVSEISTFTGLGDLHDDQVDALAAAFDKLTIPPPARGVGQTRLTPF